MIILLDINFQEIVLMYEKFNQLLVQIMFSYKKNKEKEKKK